MVFHDETLDRLTPETGPLNARTAAELARIPLRDGEGTIPDLAGLLALVAGRVPLLVEIKDQDGTLGPRVGPLEARTAALLARYGGPVALMSFNPHSAAACRDHAPGIPRGLTTCLFRTGDWPGVPAGRLETLNGLPDFDRVGASFISHHWQALAMPAVTALRARGVPVLAWTIRSPNEEAAARAAGAANITFEGYPAAH
jgi:glycerophosphoryl diester phosphodiesterase